MFDHYLLTKLNLKNPLNGMAAASEEDWSEADMWLFENCCFPSIAAQTNKNFRWLLYFDRSTTTAHKERITELIADKPYVEVFYIKGMPALWPAVQKLIESRSRKIPYLITTQITYNSILHKDFIKEVQNKFKSQSYRVINPVKGFSLKLTKNVLFGRTQYLFSKVASLIEKNTNPQTIWASKAILWKKEQRITQLTDNRLWIVATNKETIGFDGYDNVDWHKISSDFKVSEAVNNMISQKLVPNSKWLQLSLRNKILVNYRVMSKRFKKALGIYKFK